MGNCFSIKSNRARRAAEDANIPISEFEDNLDKLKTARDRLKKSKDELTKEVTDQEEGTSMKRREEVAEWLNRVERKLSAAADLISDGEEEIAQKKRGGRRRHLANQKYKCSSSLNGMIAKMKEEVDSDRKERDEFVDLVERVFAEPDHVRLLKQELEALESASDRLRRSRDELRERVKKDMEGGGGGGEKKQLQKVRVWFTEVEGLIIEINKLISHAPEEIGNWTAGEFSRPSLIETVQDRLQQVNRLKEEGDFAEVVEEEESAEAENTEFEEYLNQVEENLKALEDAREELWDLKSDLIARVNSEEKNDRKRLKSVDVWRKFAELKLAEIDRMLPQSRHEIEKLSSGDYSSNFGDQLSKMLQEVIGLKSKGVFSQVTAAQLPEQVVEIEWEQTVGLQAKLDEAWSVLMEKEVGILGIYGPGGVGKTTLLTHINNNFLNTPSDFDFVIWVLASKDYRLSSVQQQIGERIGISVNGWKEKDESEKAKEIHSILRKKKFVLLLDDLWDRIDLEIVGVPIPKRPNGSKIVLTARSELVCSLMDAKKRIRVDTLPLELAWKLFEEKVGKEALSSDPAIRPLAEQVVQKCDGLPLAVNVVARAMAFSKTAEEWRCALDDLQQSASDLQGIEDDLFTRLKISYDRLPDDKFRSCFIYSALFPAEFRISKDDLIDYWISEKFEDAGENLTRARARNIIRHLVHVCLLEDEGRYVKMHNMIRELALWISCHLEKPKYNFLVQPGKQLTEAPQVGKWEGVKRASLMENSIPKLQLSDISVCPGIRTLLLCRNPLHDITGSTAQFSPALIVLDLSNSEVDELPGLSDLSLLQYLNLSRTKMQQLPQALQKLKKLIYLNLEYNNLRDMIPKGFISSLLSLQVLRMFRSGLTFGGEASKEHIKEMQLLKHLDVVSITIGSNDTLQLYLSTKNLQSCTRALSFEHLGGSKSIEFSPTENMNRFEELHISANVHLEQIIVFSPKFSCFTSLREVAVENCPCLLNLNWLVPALNLEVLKVADCKAMKELISDSSGNPGTFPKLEVVELEKLPQLEKICSSSLSLPSWKRMKVLDCPMLSKVALEEIIRQRKIIIEGFKAEED